MDEAVTSPPSPTASLAPLDLESLDFSECSNISPVASQHTDVCSDKEVEVDQAGEKGDCVHNIQHAVQSKCLLYYKPNIKMWKPQTKSAGCVLTSQENLQSFEEKGMKKEKPEQKERARLQREEKHQKRKEEEEKKEQARLLQAEKRLKQGKGQAKRKGASEMKQGNEQPPDGKQRREGGMAPVNVDNDDQVPFTVEEMQRFKYRYNEGYDLHHDECYNLWLKAFHPAKVPCVLPVASHDISESGDLGRSSKSASATSEPGTRQTRASSPACMYTCTFAYIAVCQLCVQF